MIIYIFNLHRDTFIKNSEGAVKVIEHRMSDDNYIDKYLIVKTLQYF